ncbi:MAG: BMP family ABC transporter substrate-binding protein [Trueperaceae bacterium]|nr:BMP family ABC transporter substrate-binding protein [Trueperaceae bacterium]
MRRILVSLAALLALAFATAQDDPLKVAFIYVGPVGDYGFSYAHDLGRQATQEHFGDAIETVYVEDVPEPEVEAFIDQLVADGADVIFGTSFGYGDGILAAAQRYPDVIFGWGTGISRAPNVLTYMADFYQVYYLNGLIAAALSETGNLGYVAAFPIAEVKRHINGFALGAREVNPDAEVAVRWLYNWFDPAGATEASEALMANGADVLAFTEDTPTVIQVAADRGYPGFSHYASMVEFAPDHVASGQLVHWDTIYVDILEKVLDGTYTTTNLEDVDYFWLLEQGAVELGAEPGVPVADGFVDDLRDVVIDHPEFGEIDVYELVLERRDQMAQGRDVFEPFMGPLEDRNGNLVYEDGYLPTLGDLLSMEFAAPGVVGPWDNEPQ